MRQFLEPASSGTDSYVQIFEDEYWTDLIVADCGQRVSLSFSVSQRGGRASFERNRKARLKKLGKLEKALGIIRDKLEAAEYVEQEEQS